MERFFSGLFKELEKNKLACILVGSVFVTVVVFNEGLQYAEFMVNYVKRGNPFLPVVSLIFFFLL